MAFGVLEDPYMALPPGTSTLSDSKDAATKSADTSNLKKRGDLVLIPQPSDSPNDPLNWSKATKATIGILLSVISTTVIAMTVMLTPAIQIIAKQYSISVDTASTWTIGLLAFWTGFTASVTAAGSNVIGKRPFILASILIMVITNVWGAYTTSFVSLAVLRTLQGIASAPYETMVTAMISDLFFLHERGMWLAVWSLVISAGVLIGQVLAGVIIDQISYPATFGFSAMVFAILLLLAYLFVFETTYTKPRNNTPPLDGAPQHRDATHSAKHMSNYPPEQPKRANELTSDDHMDRLDAKLSTEFVSSFRFSLDDVDLKKEPIEEREPYPSRLRIFRGRVSNASFFRDLINPFKLMIYPSVLYGAVINGFCTAIVIGTGLLSTVLLTQPPYNLTPSQLGFVNIPPFLVGLVASPISGWMADAAAKRMAKGNGGVFEPEFRIVLMLIGIPVFSVSFVGFGESIVRGHSLPVVLTWLGVQQVGFPFVIQAVLTYVLDCHAEDSNLAFVVIAFFKAIFTFIATSFLTGVMLTVGVRAFFLGMALITAALLMLSLPMYMYGKRMRSFMARSPIGRKRAQQMASSATMDG